MFAMAVFTLVTHSFRNVEPRFLLLFSVLTACVAGYEPGIGDKFVLSRILVFYPFYLAGRVIPRDCLAALRCVKTLRVLSVAVLLVWALLCFAMLDKVYALRPLFTGRNPFGERFLPYGAAWRLMCYAITSVLVLACVLLVPARESFVTVFGGRTLQVYFWHRMVLYVLTYFGLPAHFLSKPCQVVWLLFGALLALLLSFKPFGFVTDFVMRASGRHR